MDQNESSDVTKKRYNTRPKTKTGLASLESKYSAYILDTSPKTTRKPRNPVSINYCNYQRYVQSCMDSGDTNSTQLGQSDNFGNFQAYQTQNESFNSAFSQRRVANSNYTNMYRPNHGLSLPPQMNLVYKNHPYSLHMNYHNSQGPNVVVPHSQALRGVNPMMHNHESSPYNVLSGLLNQNLKIPFRFHPNYNVTHPEYVIHPAQQGYVSSKFNFNVPFSDSTQSESPIATSKKVNLPQNYAINNSLYNQQKGAVKQDFQHQSDMPVKLVSDINVSTSSQEDRIRNYFKTVDVFLNNRSDGLNYERSENDSLGIVSVLEAFKDIDSYKMVNFEYAITDIVYSEIINYLQSFNTQDINFPVNITSIDRKNIYKTSKKDQNIKNKSSDSNNENLKADNNYDNINKNFNAVEIECVSNNFKLKLEKKIYPVTIDSYKQLSPEELRCFMTLLRNSIVRANPITKYRIKSIMNKNEDVNCNYLIYLTDNPEKKYILKQQFGFFVANNFLNKRVPLYRMVNFLKTDPSFLFGCNSGKKSQKLPQIYLKSSRSYDVYIANLNININVELSKIISESEINFKKVIHTLSVRCSVLFMPIFFKLIHINY